jgi:DNA-binding response OmpR family regulator
MAIGANGRRRATTWSSAQTVGVALHHDLLSERRDLHRNDAAMNNLDDRALILVIEDVEEIRDGLEKLLNADGYRVDPARDEEDAAAIAARESPDLLLMSSGARRTPAISTVREQLGLSEKVPVVVFCGDTIAEGTEQLIGTNAYLSRPDNFNQLRNLLRRLLEPNA